MAGIKPSFVGFWLKIQTRSLSRIQTHTRRNINCLWAIIYLKAEIPDHLPRWFFINFICPRAANKTCGKDTHGEETGVRWGKSGRYVYMCARECFSEVETKGFDGAHLKSGSPTGNRPLVADNEPTLCATAAPGHALPYLHKRKPPLWRCAAQTQSHIKPSWAQISETHKNITTTTKPTHILSFGNKIGRIYSKCWSIHLYRSCTVCHNPIFFFVSFFARFLFFTFTQYFKPINHLKWHYVHRLWDVLN
jgi:hypothetical protein